MRGFPNLYEWIHTVGPGDFPPAPLLLRPGVTVEDWEKFICYLQADCKGRQIRARWGALQQDLRELYLLWISVRTK